MIKLILTLLFFGVNFGFSQTDESEEILSTEALETLLDQLVPLPEKQEAISGDQPDLFLNNPDYLVLSKLMKRKIKPIKPIEEAIEFGDWDEKEIAAINQIFKFDINSFFTVRRPYFLYDPYEYLTTVEKEDSESFLAKYAGESEANLYILILRPEDYNQLNLLREAGERYFGDYEQAALLIYFYENPEVTDVIFSKTLSKSLKERGSSAYEELVGGLTNKRESNNHYNVFRRWIDDFCLMLKRTQPKSAVTLSESKLIPSEISESIEQIKVDPTRRKPLLPLFSLILIALLGSVLFLTAKKKKSEPIVLKLSKRELPLGFPRASFCSGMMSFEEKSSSPEEQFDKLYKTS